MGLEWGRDPILHHIWGCWGLKQSKGTQSCTDSPSTLSWGRAGVTGVLTVTGLRFGAPTCVLHGVLLAPMSLGLQEGADPDQAQAAATCCPPAPSTQGCSLGHPQPRLAPSRAGSSPLEPRFNELLPSWRSTRARFSPRG